MNTLTAVLAAAVLSLAACGGDDGGDSGTTPSAGGTTSAGASSSAPAASEIKVGLAYDIGGRGDQSFNDAAAAGLEKAKAELGIADTNESEAQPNEKDAAKEERLRALADDGYNPVIAVGFAYAAPLKKVAPEFPEVKFGIIDDASVTAPNVAGLTFAEEQGSYLVGVIAALKSTSGTVGFIGGVNVPLINKFEAGFKAGAAAGKAGTKVVSKYLTQPPDFTGFNDPAKGKTAAQGMFDGGADVVYVAAGGSGGGAFEAAKADGKKVIGVDSDQAKTAAAGVRDVIISSMLKKVDVAVYDFIKKVNDDQFAAGQTTYDLKVSGVDYSTTGGQIDDIKAQVDSFKEKIIAGSVTVPTK